MTESAYDALISEAFITPIRSVLIVDDQYPTLNEILAEGDEEQTYLAMNKDWRQNKASVRRILKQFRDPKAPFLLDIHDGKLPEEQTDEDGAEELQQTDLLVLDYQLDPGVSHGESALKIARRALSNEHFNLILVHTENDLETVFYEFVTGLYEPSFAALAEKINDPAVDAFQDEFADAMGRTVGPRLWAEALRAPRSWVGDLCGNNPIWNEPRLLLEKGTREIGGFSQGKWRAAMILAFATIETERSAPEPGRPVKILSWNGEGVRYIRTDRGFMAFRSKEDDPSVPLLDTVKAALYAWRPRPSRLLLTKLRAEMNKRGIEVQDDALGETNIGAIWYRELLSSPETQTSVAVDRTVRNHAEQLLDKILPGVRDFASRMIRLENRGNATAAVYTRFGIDLTISDEERRAVLGHNAFVGSKPPSGAHLELGHILLVRDQHWLCMTPACDLIPHRTGGANRPDKTNDLKRFIALRLYLSDEIDLLATATRGGRLFVNLIDRDGATTPKAFQMASEDSASPAWITMYADGDGVFADNGALRTCTVKFVKATSENVGIAEEPATLVGHLRPEYALDIQSRLNSSHGRIGLDHMTFVPPPTSEDP